MINCSKLISIAGGKFDRLRTSFENFHTGVLSTPGSIFIAAKQLSATFRSIATHAP